MQARSAILLLLPLGAGAHASSGDVLPAWWVAFQGVPRMEAAFVQVSESAVFGKLERKGTLRLGRGGRLRAAYADGLELVADGQNLIQYDPDTRTAQIMSLAAATADTPLLRLLTDPSRLKETYAITAAPRDQVLLKPLKPGLPEVRIEGSGKLPRRLHWKDASGAGQVLELVGARVPPQDFSAATFRFQAPKGTRWIGK